MLATTLTEHYPFFHSDHAAKPLEVHRSKISLHRAKAGYSYPTVRLPHTFSKLAGLQTRIYQTVQDGGLAFLVVVSPKGSASENDAKSSKKQVNALRKLQSNQLVQISLNTPFFLQSDAKILADDAKSKGKKLHNSDEMLHNSGTLTDAEKRKSHPHLCWISLSSRVLRPANKRRCARKY